MELKDATNFLLLKEYIQERNNQLHYFENLIIQENAKCFLEPQLFFFLKDENMNRTASYLQRKYESVLKDISSFAMQIAEVSNDGNIWICSNRIVRWAEVKRCRFGQEILEWEPCYGDVWNSFPNGLYQDSDYKILYIDDLVSIVLFYKKVQVSNVDVNKKQVLQYGYQLSCQKSCDIFYEVLDDISYSFWDNQETMKRLGIQEYFRWLQSYEESAARRLRIK